MVSLSWAPLTRKLSTSFATLEMRSDFWSVTDSTLQLFLILKVKEVDDYWTKAQNT